MLAIFSGGDKIEETTTMDERLLLFAPHMFLSCRTPQQLCNCDVKMLVFHMYFNILLLWFR